MLGNVRSILVALAGWLKRAAHQRPAGPKDYPIGRV